MNIVKTVAKRDSATAILRKLGVKPKDYELFITPTADGRQAVLVSAARDHLGLPAESLEQHVPTATEEQKAEVEELRAKIRARAKKAKVERATTRRAISRPYVEAGEAQPGETTRAYTLRQIRSGHTNVEIFDGLVKYFGATHKQRTYPAWYRNWLRVHGEEHYVL